MNIKVGDGRILEATEVGKFTALFLVYGNRIEIKLNSVFYVKEMKANLLSYSKITDNNSIVSQGDVKKIITHLDRPEL